MLHTSRLSSLKLYFLPSIFWNCNKSFKRIQDYICGRSPWYRRQKTFILLRLCWYSFRLLYKNYFNPSWRSYLVCNTYSSPDFNTFSNDLISSFICNVVIWEILPARFRTNNDWHKYLYLLDLSHFQRNSLTE